MLSLVYSVGALVLLANALCRAAPAVGRLEGKLPDANVETNTIDIDISESELNEIEYEYLTATARLYAKGKLLTFDIPAHVSEINEIKDRPLNTTAIQRTVDIQIDEGELGEVDERGRAKHSLSSWEWNHLKRTSTIFTNEKKYQYTTKSWAKDEYSVKPGDSDECLVLIAGTNSIQDWISNVNIPFRTLKADGKDILTGHGGFVIAAVAVAQDLLQQVQTNCGSRDVLTFAGHSRGGAIAQILATLYYKRNIFKSVKLVSWGSPRALSEASADKFHNVFDQVRVVNDYDPVTTQPARLFGYKHMGMVVCLDCIQTNQDATGGYSFNVANHYMKTYNVKIQSISV
eukprot:CFRG8261T1